MSKFTSCGIRNLAHIIGSCAHLERVEVHQFILLFDQLSEDPTSIDHLFNELYLNEIKFLEALYNDKITLISKKKREGNVFVEKYLESIQSRIDSLKNLINPDDIETVPLILNY